MIRKAELQDISELNKLGIKVISNFEVTYNLKNYLESKDYLVLVSIDKLINGFLIMKETMDTYELELIYVREDKRLQHIATNLINNFLNNYYNKSKDIFLEVNVNNVEAIKLYQKFNFEIINIRPKYYNGLDAYVMKRVKDNERC